MTMMRNVAHLHTAYKVTKQNILSCMSSHIPLAFFSFGLCWGDPQLPESKSFSPSCAANIHKKKRFHRCSRQSMVSSVSFSSAGVTQWKNSLAGPHNSSRHFWTMSDCVLLMIFSLPKGSKIHTDYVRDPRCNRCTVASLLLKQNSSCHLGVFTCCFWLALNPTTSRFPRMHWPS